MFEYFTFGAQAKSRSYQDESSASPTDISFSARSQHPAQHVEFPFPEVSSSSQPDINDIVHQFSTYTLRTDENEAPQPSICPDTNTSIATFEDSDEDLIYLSTRNGPTHLFDRPYFSQHRATSSTYPPSSEPISCKRTQRQIHTQFQLQAFTSTKPTVRDRSSLVESMISSEEQCTLHNSTSRSSLRSSPSPTQAHHVHRRTLGSREECFVVDDGEIVVDEEMELGEGYRGYGIDRAISRSREQSFALEDEGFSEMDSDENGDQFLVPSSLGWAFQEEMRLRRASTPSGIRKSSHGGGIIGATAIGAGVNGSNAVFGMGSGNGVGYGYGYGCPQRERSNKVRSVPRMRKRKNCVTITE